MKSTGSLGGIRKLDPNGRIFEWRGEVYRAIFPEFVPIYEKLFVSGLMEEMIHKKELLVETEKTNLYLPGYGMILKHRRIPYITRVSEWTPNMVRDAALTVIDLNLELLTQNLGMVDFHSANILFDRMGRPKWVDLGSIIRVDPDAPMDDCEEFYEYFLYPLLLMEDPRLHRVMRHLHQTYGLKRKEFLAIKGELPPGMENLLPRKIVLKNLRHIIERITLKPATTTWGDYYQNYDVKLRLNLESLSGRSAAVYSLLCNLKPKSVVDLDANRGFFTLMAAATGASVIAIDYDEDAMEGLYSDIRGLDKKYNIYLALLDLLTIKEEQAKRYQSEMALALALTHHLSLSQQFPFWYIAKVFSYFCTKYLITEFMPNGLGVGQISPDPLPEFYTIENLMDALKQHFSKVSIIDYELPPNCSPRTLILCER